MTRKIHARKKIIHGIEMITRKKYTRGKTKITRYKNNCFPSASSVAQLIS